VAEKLITKEAPETSSMFSYYIIYGR